MMDVHQYLYSDDSALFGSDYSDIYDNSIHHTDRVIGELLTDMAEQGLLEKTLIVWTSDHGEAFNERGYEGHAQTVYRETTDVPFLISFPFQLESRLVIETHDRRRRRLADRPRPDRASGPPGYRRALQTPGNPGRGGPRRRPRAGSRLLPHRARLGEYQQAEDAPDGDRGRWEPSIRDGHQDRRRARRGALRFDRRSGRAGQRPRRFARGRRNRSGL